MVCNFCLTVSPRGIYHTIAVYTYLVTHHNDPAVLETIVQTLIIEIVFSNLIAIFVQMYMTLVIPDFWLDLIFYLQVLRYQDLQT